MSFNPYNISREEIERWGVSEPITDPSSLARLKLLAKVNEIISNMDSSEGISLTGLDKSDLSRVRVGDYKRFSTDRLIRLIDCLGHKLEMSFRK